MVKIEIEVSEDIKYLLESSEVWYGWTPEELIAQAFKDHYKLWSNCTVKEAVSDQKLYEQREAVFKAYNIKFKII